MLVMRTIESPAYSVGEFVGSEQTVGLYDFALAMNPFGLDGVQPRTLLGQKTAQDPNSASALFHSAVVFSEPSPDLFADVPGSVVPDQKKNLLARLFELFKAPSEELGGYGAYGPAVHEAQPSVADLGQVESIAGDGFRLGVVSLATDRWRRRWGSPFSEKLLRVGKATRLHQHSSWKPVAHSGSMTAISISRSRRLFF
jgi:hypothetical protein